MSIVQYVTQLQLWNTGPSALHHWWKPLNMHEDELSLDLDSIIEVISEHSRRHVAGVEPAEAVAANAPSLVDGLIETIVEPMDSNDDEPITAVEQSEVELPQGIFTHPVPSSIMLPNYTPVTYMHIYRSTYLGLERY